MSIIDPNTGRITPRGIGTIFAVATSVIIGITILFGSWYTVDQGDRAVITRNGAVVGESDPGLHFKTPWIDSVTQFDVRTQRVHWDKISAYSKDIQPTDIKLSLNYHVDPSKVREIYSTLGVQYSSRVIEPNTLRAVKDVFGKYVATDIINSRDQLGAALTADLSKSLLSYGVIVEAIQMENIDFSDAYEKSVEQRMQAEVAVKQKEQELRSAEVDAQKARAVAEGTAAAVKAQADGEAYRSAAVSKGEAQATKTNAEANAYKISVEAKAEADAIHLKADALRANPLIIELTKAQAWDGKLPTMQAGNITPIIDLRAAKE